MSFVSEIDKLSLLRLCDQRRNQDSVFPCGSLPLCAACRKKPRIHCHFEPPSRSRQGPARTQEGFLAFSSWTPDAIDGRNELGTSPQRTGRLISFKVAPAFWTPSPS